MERSDQLEKVWSELMKYTTIQDIERHPHFFSDNDLDMFDYGGYAKVYKSANGDDYVLKITSSGGDGWVPFAHRVANERLYETNPLFPKIQSRYLKELKVFHQGSYNGAIAFVERVYTSPIRVNKLVTKAIRQMGSMTSNTSFNISNCAALFEAAFEEYVDTGGDVGIIIDSVCEAFEINKDHMLEFFWTINDLMINHGSVILLDMHNSNIGFRKDGGVVFFDPVN